MPNLAKFVCIMSDETTDISNHEQAIIMFRWVDNYFDVFEDFIGLHRLDNTKSDEIVYMLKDVLKRCDISITQKLRCQSYDGAANMSGVKNGVVTQIQKIEERAVFIHCNGHLINLAAQDTIKFCVELKQALDYAYEIIKLIKLSPSREATFLKVKAEIGDVTSGTVRKLCPNRWTVRANSFYSIIKNYSFLIQGKYTSMYLNYLAIALITYFDDQ